MLYADVQQITTSDGISFSYNPGASQGNYNPVNGGGDVFWNLLIFDTPDDPGAANHINKYPATLWVTGQDFDPNDVGNKISVSDGRYTFSFDPSAYVIQSINLFPTFGTLGNISIGYQIGETSYHLIGGENTWNLEQRFEYNSSILNTSGLFDESVTELSISFTPTATGRGDDEAYMENRTNPFDGNPDGNAFVGYINFGGYLREPEVMLFAAAATESNDSSAMYWYHSIGNGEFAVNAQSGPPPAAAPEPATMLILGLGLAGLGLARRKR